MRLSQFFKKKTTVGTHHTYGLTQLGKTKAEEFSLSGPKWEVLACLSENGPSSITEISTEINTSPDKVKAMLRGLLKNGYIRQVSAEE